MLSDFMDFASSTHTLRIREAVMSKLMSANDGGTNTCFCLAIFSSSCFRSDKSGCNCSKASLAGFCSLCLRIASTKCMGVTHSL